ncbi:MAG: hypothetical protein LBS50_07255 [Prevotellaceae bacterium]|nr:hypothetical protein [Prevotellaceae bacterium]
MNFQVSTMVLVSTTLNQPYYQCSMRLTLYGRTHRFAHTQNILPLVAHLRRAAWGGIGIFYQY